MKKTFNSWFDHEYWKVNGALIKIEVGNGNTEYRFRRIDKKHYNLNLAEFEALMERFRNDNEPK